jgi:hypothetical protein
MSATQVQTDEKPQFYVTEEHHPENSTMLGFWLYLMSDCLIFAMLFATHGVLGRNYAAGPSPADLFDLNLVAINTAMLLLSSITYGFAMLQMERNAKMETLVWLGVTGVFGAAFLGLELYEFYHLILEGAGPTAFRIPVLVLHAGRHARPARHLRHDLADHADGAGRAARPQPGKPSPADVPVRCSGTSSTSSGSASSPSSTCWESSDELAPRKRFGHPSRA